MSVVVIVLLVRSARAIEVLAEIGVVLLLSGAGLAVFGFVLARLEEKNGVAEPGSTQLLRAVGIKTRLEARDATSNESNSTSRHDERSTPRRCRTTAKNGIGVMVIAPVATMPQVCTMLHAGEESLLDCRGPRRRGLRRQKVHCLIAGCSCCTLFWVGSSRDCAP
jgi:hypothetical protein